MSKGDPSRGCLELTPALRIAHAKGALPPHGPHVFAVGPHTREVRGSSGALAFPPAPLPSVRQAPQVIGLGLLTEAIGWHGGEASASRARFEALSKDDRDALLTFLESL